MAETDQPVDLPSFSGGAKAELRSGLDKINTRIVREASALAAEGDGGGRVSELGVSAK